MRFNERLQEIHEGIGWKQMKVAAALGLAALTGTHAKAGIDRIGSDGKPDHVFDTTTDILNTGSMQPLIKGGARVYIDTDVDIRDIKTDQDLGPGKGDIIVYQDKFGPAPRGNICHRAIAKRKHGDQIVIIAKGDNNEQPDMAPVYQSMIIGRVGKIFNAKDTNIGIKTQRPGWQFEPDGPPVYNSPEPMPRLYFNPNTAKH